jgi:Anaphase-promoting complex subunit 11 RING-H2 finger
MSYTAIIRQTGEVYSNNNFNGSDSGEPSSSFITVHSMLILLSIILFIVVCLCGCILFGRSTNTLFTYKNDYLTNSRSVHGTPTNTTDVTTRTDGATTLAASSIHSSESDLTTDIRTPTLLLTTENDIIKSSIKCFGIITVRTATTENALSNEENDANDKGAFTNRRDIINVQAEFDNGNDIIDLSNNNNSNDHYIVNSSNGIDDVESSNDHHDIHNHHHNVCCVICLVDYVHGDAIYRNHPFCLHFFHTHCIQQWVQQQQQQQQATATTISPSPTGNHSSECPCCRCPINPILPITQ